MKFRAFIVFTIIFGILPDVFLTCYPALQEVPLLWKLPAFIPTVIFLACLPCIGLGIRYTSAVRLFSYTTFIVGLPKLLFCLALLIAYNGSNLAMAAGVGAGIAAGVALFFCGLIFFSSRQLKVTERTIGLKGLPKEWDGLRLCQIGDMHLGSYGNAHGLVRRIVAKVQELQPDIICFVGDLVNFSAKEAVPYADDLKGLQAPLGVFSIRGNHDFLLHGHHSEESRKADTEDLLALERSLGWRVLMNENTTLERGGAPLALAGVDNVSSNPYFLHTGGDLKKAMEGIPEGLFTILMSHDPSHWRREVVSRTDIGLTLSGHTHGLGYKTAGLNIKHWKLPESKGIYTEGSQVLHVTEGLGSAFAFRLGGYPSVDILTLKTKA